MKAPIINDPYKIFQELRDLTSEQYRGDDDFEFHLWKILGLDEADYDDKLLKSLTDLDFEDISEIYQADIESLVDQRIKKGLDGILWDSDTKNLKDFVVFSKNKKVVKKNTLPDDETWRIIEVRFSEELDAVKRKVVEECAKNIEKFFKKLNDVTQL
jgi:hypothetical protein